MSGVIWFFCAAGVDPVAQLDDRFADLLVEPADGERLVLDAREVQRELIGHLRCTRVVRDRAAGIDVDSAHIAYGGTSSGMFTGSLGASIAMKTSRTWSIAPTMRPHVKFGFVTSNS
jgi:hypothetical protein